MTDSSCEAIELPVCTVSPASRYACLNPANEVPAYMREVYDWAYVDPRKVHWLDHNIVVKTL